MINIKEDIDSPQLFTHFGTVSPYWRLTADSDALELSGDQSTASVAVELSAAQADIIRQMTGVIASLAMDITIFGGQIKVHLVGRKIDTWEWGGTAAHYGDTDTVAKDLELGLDFAEQVVSEVNSLVVILDSAGRIKRFNRLCEEVTGMKEADLLGKNAHDLFIPEDVRDESRAAIGELFLKTKSYEVIRPIKTKKGVRLIHWRNTHMQSGSGVPERYLVCSGTDITDEREAQQHLEVLANTDVLTGLLNRHAIDGRINRLVAEKDAASFGLIYLDLDNFKKVNDHYGHSVGDTLLKKVAALLVSVLSANDIVARLGGDEFLIIVANASRHVVENTARRILDSMKPPFALQRAEVYSGCSIGIAMFPEHGHTLEKLVRGADTAMYVAKEAGRRTFRVFNEEMNNKLSEYMWLDSNMRRALEENQFELYYQPKISLSTNKIESVEALLRWNHPERGVLLPGGFIPYAEESGLIVPLGRWVMETAARQAAIWQRRGMKIRVAINLSARQLLVPTIVDDFTQAILSQDLSPSIVDLELTESCLIEDEKLAHRLIRKFRELGAEVHLDDFGTGYSSLSQLTRLQLNVLKLDGSFIKSVHSDARARALVRSMVAVGHELNLRIVAEGVETEEQATFLRSIGVDYAQGFLYVQPLKLAEFEAYMQASSGKGLYLVG
jgi:cyclic di-GMP phosphodiesterase Gmr